MTHSLHREGTIDSLEKDYALFIYPARGFNYDGSGPKLRRLAELLYTQSPAPGDFDVGPLFLLFRDFEAHFLAAGRT